MKITGRNKNGLTRKLLQHMKPKCAYGTTEDEKSEVTPNVTASVSKPSEVNNMIASRTVNECLIIFIHCNNNTKILLPVPICLHLRALLHPILIR